MIRTNVLRPLEAVQAVPSAGVRALDIVLKQWKHKLMNS
jgi:hypothetical protein